jgi:peroxiredoxin
LVIAVSDSAENMKAFLDDGGWTFPVMLDGDEVASDYGVDAIPTQFIIDSEGRIVDSILGGVSAEDLVAIVDSL